MALLQTQETDLEKATRDFQLQTESGLRNVESLDSLQETISGQRADTSVRDKIQRHYDTASTKLDRYAAERRQRLWLWLAAGAVCFVCATRSTGPERTPQ